MDIEQYYNESDKTLKIYDSKKENELHMFFGIVTEFGELMGAFKKHLIYEKKLDLENVKEEVGDILFYFVNLVKFQINTDEEKSNFITNFKNLYENALEEKENIIKDEVVENMNPISMVSKITDSLDNLLHIVFTILVKYEIDINDVLQQNRNKLDNRYPDGYSNENAVKRKDKNG